MELHHYENQTEHKIAVDLICGMDVDITKTSLKHEHNGKTYYFCSDHCLGKFSWEL